MSTGVRPRYDSPNQTCRRLKTYTSAQASIDKKIVIHKKYTQIKYNYRVGYQFLLKNKAS